MTDGSQDSERLAPSFQTPIPIPGTSSWTWFRRAVILTWVLLLFGWVTSAADHPPEQGFSGMQAFSLAVIGIMSIAIAIMIGLAVRVESREERAGYTTIGGMTRRHPNLFVLHPRTHAVVRYPPRWGTPPPPDWCPEP